MKLSVKKRIFAAKILKFVSTKKMITMINSNGNEYVL